MAAEIGAPAPDFTLKDQNRNDVSLADFSGKNTLVVFIPFPFTGICDSEACAIRDNLQALNAVDANVVIITAHAAPTNQRWAEEQGFEFPVLADYWPHGAIAQAYGCFNETVGAAMRATYVLDGEGVVRQIVATDSLGTPREFAAYTDALATL